jgi:hypothetical protein
MLSVTVVSTAPEVEQDEMDVVICTEAAASTATSDSRSSKVVTVAPLSVLRRHTIPVSDD